MVPDLNFFILMYSDLISQMYWSAICPFFILAITPWYFPILSVDIFFHIFFPVLDFVRRIDPSKESFQNETRSVVIPMGYTALYFNQSRFAFVS